MLCSFNSFEEGEYKNTGGTSLRNVWYDDSSVILHIKDNGCGISEEIIDKINHLDPSIDADDKDTGFNGIGLVNIQKRLRLTYGNNYGISIQKNFKDGTHILIRIPKKETCYENTNCR